MEFSKLAMRVLEQRYLHGETPNEMFSRVAEHIAGAETDKAKQGYWKEKFEWLMQYFLPNSPCLMNAGRPLGQLAACFVIPVPDDMIGICDALKKQAIIQKTGGGTGFSFSDLRPAGAGVASTQGLASGPISFMRVFNELTETVKQGGMRRGANMGMLNVWHPDIEEFVDCKVNGDQFTNFNISVALSDEFMRAVEDNKKYGLHHPKAAVVKNINAAELFDKIAYNAWYNGEPGVVFIDTINRAYPLPYLIKATNPCGEQPLEDDECCDLGSINLAKMVRNGEVNWGLLRDVVWVAVRLLDNVIDVNNYPLPEIREKALATRKIGLGPMGWADMLIQLGIRYDSLEAVELADKVSKFIQLEAIKASQSLAEEKGAYPLWEKDKRSEGWKPMRNCTVTTVAPTGTLSILANCSSGIQAVFAFDMERGHLDETNHWVHPLWEKRKELGLKDEVFVRERDIHWSWLVRHQAAWQKHVCNAVSMTINMPKTATVEDVKEAYMMGWKAGCKGLTVYRDGSREGQILRDSSAGKANEAVEADTGVAPNSIVPRPRPKRAYGFTDEIQVGCGKLFVTFNQDAEGHALETFVETGKTGGCSAQSAAIGQLISVGLRSGIKVEEIIKRLRGIKCPACTNKGLGVTSCPDAVARVLQGKILIQKKAKKAEFVENCGNSCPECGAKLMHSGGCVTCTECGWSKCN